jgi:hypothetical protein
VPLLPVVDMTPDDVDELADRLVGVAPGAEVGR